MWCAQGLTIMVGAIIAVAYIIGTLERFLYGKRICPCLAKPEGIYLSIYLSIYV